MFVRDCDKNDTRRGWKNLFTKYSEILTEKLVLHLKWC